jgi:hypothetical protein
LYYLKLVLREGWPWWWTVALGWIGVFSFKVAKPWRNSIRARWPQLTGLLDGRTYRGYCWNAFAFFLAFALPFSFVKYQLPHYLHPTYLVMAPVGGALVAAFLQDLRWGPSILRASRLALPRWMALVVIGGLVFLFSKGVSHTANRGQDFMSVAARLEPLPVKCKVVVSETIMDAYRMEAYALWYWQGREWELMKDTLPSKIAVPRLRVYWEPGKDALWGNGECKI